MSHLSLQWYAVLLIVQNQSLSTTKYVNKQIRMQSSKHLRKIILVLLCFYLLPTSSCFSPDQNYREDIVPFGNADQSSLAIALQPFATSTPDETNLTDLVFPVIGSDGQPEKINIARAIGNDYSEDFGFELLGSLKRYRIAKILTHTKAAINRIIIMEWLTHTGKTPVTFGTLIGVLHEIGLSRLADKINVTCEVLNITDIPIRLSSVNKYSQRLVKRYQRESIMNNTQWLPRRFSERNITIQFVDLEMKENGNKILLQDLISGMHSGTRTLMFGRPGVGKTTIVRHLSKMWANGDLSNLYLVIKLNLGVIGKIDNLRTLLQVSDKSFSADDLNTVSEYLNETRGNGTCIFLDSFDKYAFDSSDYVSSLIQGDSLSESVVILTSRPSATEDIEPYFHHQRKIEVIGFGDESIKNYLDQLNLIQDKNQTIYQYFDNHPSIRQLCYLPLHLSMLVYIAVVTTDSNTLSLVDTETELYYDFLSQTIAQYKKLSYKQVAESYTECFVNNYTTNDQCLLFRSICRVAFIGAVRRELTFNSSSFDNLTNSSNLKTEIESLNLFKIDYNKHGNFKYHYSHPTFQEFLAAFHLTTLSMNERTYYIQYSWMRETYKFSLGLISRKLNRKFNDRVVFKMFVTVSIKVLATFEDQKIYVIKCAHEVAVGHASLFVKLLQAVNIITEKKSVNAKINPPRRSYEYSEQESLNYATYDCWYIGYLLTQSTLYELQLVSFSMPTYTSCLGFINNFLEYGPTGGVRVTRLVLGEYRDGFWGYFNQEENPELTFEVQRFLSTFLYSPTDIEFLFLRFENGSSILQLGEIMKSFQDLKSFTLGTTADIINEGYLVNALQGLSNLNNLNLGMIHANFNAQERVFEQLKGLEQLERLTLELNWSTITDSTNTTALIGGLVSLTSLKIISLNIFSARSYHATELFRGLEMLYSSGMTLFLDLDASCWEYDLGDISTKELTAVLKKLSTLIGELSLCIEFGIPGLSGPKELVEGLRGLTELPNLLLDLKWKLDSNSDVDEACLVLAEGLQSLSNLKVLALRLKQNGSISKIKSAFKSLIQLEELTLKWRSPGDKTDVAELFGGLSDLNKLRKLDLSWTAIGDSDIAPLVESLKEMNQLSVLDLSNNEIGDKGIQSLANAIDSNYLSHLEALYLAYNKLTVVGAEILSQKVAKLSRLRIFDLGGNFGSYSANALIAIQMSLISGNESSTKWHGSIIDSTHAFILTFTVVVGGILILCVLALVWKFPLIQRAFPLTRAVPSSTTTIRTKTPTVAGTMT